jgi:DUF1680 family protein
MNITRREFSRLIALAAAAPSAAREVAYASTAEPAAAMALESFNYTGVRLLDGMFKQQVQSTKQAYFDVSDDSYLFGFRQRAGLPAPGVGLDGWYGTDTFHAFGQYLAGMARLSKATNDKPLGDKAIFLMREWGKTIEPDGYFFYSKHPNFYHYSYEKTIGGLNDIYEYLGEKEALVYLDRITDWAIKNLDRARPNPGPTPPFQYTGDAGEWYTLGENLYRAYLNTGDSKYKTFAAVWHYDKFWSGFAEGQPDVAYRHAYSHLNSFSSAAMAYKVTGDQAFLKTITNAYDYIHKTQCFATGGYGPSERLRPTDGSLGRAVESEQATFETPCGSWAVFKLGRYLQNFTGEACYGDWMEQLAYNGIGAALPMSSSGKTFYDSDYRVCGSTKLYFQKTWPCCSGTYPQAVADYHNMIYLKNAQGLYVNLFVPSEVTWNHRGERIILRQETSYPEDSKVSFSITSERSSEFPLNFRVPGWSKKPIIVRVNGAVESVSAQPGSWATIKRLWKSGDKVELEIPLEFALVPIDPQHPKRVAITRGPVVFVRKGQGAVLNDMTGWKRKGNDSAVFLAEVKPNIELVPFYRMVQDEPYLMYFDI